MKLFQGRVYDFSFTLEITHTQRELAKKARLYLFFSSMRKKRVIFSLGVFTIDMTVISNQQSDKEWV